MTKKVKKASPLSSDKEKLKANASLLPVKPVKPVDEPVKPVEDIEVSALVEQIKATGFLKNVFCNGFDFVLTRQKKTRLTADEKVMLEDPLNKLEVKFLEMLPEIIRKQADKGGPIIELVAAVGIIAWTKSQEAKKPVEKLVTSAPGEIKVDLN